VDVPIVQELAADREKASTTLNIRCFRS